MMLGMLKMNLKILIFFFFFFLKALTDNRGLKVNGIWSKKGEFFDWKEKKLNDIFFINFKLFYIKILSVIYIFL